MNSFTVTTLVTRKAYMAYFIGALYKRPLTIIACFLGICMLLISLRDYPSSPSGSYSSFISDVGTGLFLLFFPILIALISSRKFNANPSMRQGIVYTFSEDAIVAKGLTFDSTMKWPHIIKWRETKKFLVLQATRQTGFFVDKTQLTQEQIHFIKSKIGKKQV